MGEAAGMPSIPPFENPFSDFDSRFRLRAHNQTGPFRHGPQAYPTPEDEWVEHLDLKARLSEVPREYITVLFLLHQGETMDSVCQRTGLDRSEVQAAKAWLRQVLPPADPGPTGGPYGSLDVTC